MKYSKNKINTNVQARIIMILLSESNKFLNYPHKEIKPFNVIVKYTVNSRRLW